MTRVALITGITGQDGSYLAELLLSKGYEVHGLVRRASTFNTGRLDDIYQDPHEIRPRLNLHYGDLSDGLSIANLIREIVPTEVYHLGAQSHVRVSFDMPEYTGDITGLATTRLLEAIHKSGVETRFYQASSSELYGSTPPPQSETTPFHPRSPYAVAKLYGFWATVNYREAYDLFACNGILFNHESPRRGETFVTRKITRAVARIAAGQQDKLYLGNLDAVRDWGYAPEYVEGMWRMLQADTPDDYVLATGHADDRARVLRRRLRPRRPRLGAVRRLRPALRAPVGGRRPHRRPEQGQGAARLGGPDVRREARRRHGRRRCREPGSALTPGPIS